MTQQGDYQPEHFKELFELESHHFWFRGRNRIIQNAFARFIGNHASVLEVGCGTAFVLAGLSQRFPSYILTGADLFAEGLSFARTRLPHANFIQLDLREIPFINKFDAIGAFDVIEHIDEDELVLKNLHRSLKKGGYIFITVPQHKWLWSKQDEAACHKRRYTRHELKQKLINAGFAISFMSSFVTLLLPLMILSRLRKKKSRKAHGLEYSYDELRIPDFLNKFLELGMRADEVLIKRGISLPLGGSLLAVARKS